MPLDPTLKVMFRPPTPPGPYRFKLQPGAIDPFLIYLFSDIARRPQKLGLSETAAVARYLRLLSVASVPNDVARGGEQALQHYAGKERQEDLNARSCLEEISNIIWNSLFQHGEFDMASSNTAIQFLETHRQTYLANAPVDDAIALVKSRQAPVGAISLFKPPALRSRSRTVLAGREKSHLPNNDLSELIFIADVALTWAGIRRNRRKRIAAALNSIDVPKRGDDPKWESTDVHERVKEFRRRQTLRYKALNLRWDSASEMLVNSRLDSFRVAMLTKAARNGELDFANQCVTLGWDNL